MAWMKRAGLQKLGYMMRKVMEYCEQMTPVVRPQFTEVDETGLTFVSAEISPVDITEQPCFKTAKGGLRGSYTQVGNGDKPMTEYEVYSYEAFRKKYQDDIRPAEKMGVLNPDEKLGKTKNPYSGIPTIRFSMKNQGFRNRSFWISAVNFRQPFTTARAL